MRFVPAQNAVAAKRIVANVPNQVMTDPHSQRILVLDFGAQYAQLIARRVREAGVYCELHPYDMPAQEIKAFAPRGVILSGPYIFDTMELVWLPQFHGSAYT